MQYFLSHLANVILLAGLVSGSVEGLSSDEGLDSVEGRREGLKALKILADPAESESILLPEDRLLRLSQF